jgi:hypothetical protein
MVGSTAHRRTRSADVNGALGGHGPRHGLQLHAPAPRPRPAGAHRQRSARICMRPTFADALRSVPQREAHVDGERVDELAAAPEGELQHRPGAPRAAAERHDASARARRGRPCAQHTRIQDDRLGRAGGVGRCRTSRYLSLPPLMSACARVRCVTLAPPLQPCH